ncbi:MAG: membrane-associated zinc metalloprotease [Candidatus Moranbacteria bacterium GW2011_GWC1_45_18]|nr:MAG: Membrane-associated zinc metalloprotease [Candidatus Moranbacteria bacterium GW2011_GWC2_40_12]KKT33305.1 MAG: Membrane-associated zinc metalloprotease [Candidatus Moranbacteria bacterium GW2011_GWF2_44_10]KKT99285.1 MAG: membrane-associated zinc metalloprotease [Candidatus Moranbacteria bacterium GW2011_GWC1_45_18]OGI40644.1 MAG: RIP metalloprotease RseP [Candidatus Moranbacteria bacterium RIFOXYB1_FULL_44_23]OGI43162.1 MAG: RIP metalloprotease RseP [Candidatus Moranbacteria bacterium 
MITVLIFILVLGLLVFVHEFGHFLVARRNGVEVEEFGFGFPPRAFGFYWNKKGKRKIIWGSKEIEEIREARKIGEEKTVYSVNWIPLGGFVKIIGEDGEEKSNPKSFASKPPFARIRILAAGVAMNFLLAIALFSLGFWLGVPQPVEEVEGGRIGSEKIHIVDVGKGTPAEAMGIRAGDEILGAVMNNNLLKFSSVEEVQNFIGENKGSQVVLEIQRGKEKLEISGTPRADFPEGEGPLGIGLAKIVIAKYPWYKAIALGFQYTFDLTVTFISFLGLLIWRLIVGQPAGLDVSGPVGIAVLTGQVAQLGFDYLIRFTAMLSVNLAIINILPIPALDGGRILFILIERLKGSPVSQKFEQRAHSLGFALLISLMVFVTVRDFAKFDLVEKIKNLM